MENAKLNKEGYAMIIFYFLSLNKPEFTEYAKKLTKKTKRINCFNVAWCIVIGQNTPVVETQKLITFIREYCERNNWDLTEWFKTQSKVSNHFKTTKFLNQLDFKPNNSHKVIALYDNDDPG